jgi:hypothetical protein
MKMNDNRTIVCECNESKMIVKTDPPKFGFPKVQICAACGNRIDFSKLTKEKLTTKKVSRP